MADSRQVEGQEVLHSGWLRKKPPQHTFKSTFLSDRTRFFRLTRTALHFAKDEKGRSKGTIALSTVLGLDRLEHGLVVHTTSRDWVLLSLKDGEAGVNDLLGWVDAITNCLAPLPGKLARRESRSVSVGALAEAEPKGDLRDRAQSTFGADLSSVLGSHITTFVRKKVSQKKYRFQKDGFDLDLSYITPRLIAMGFPSQGVEGVYRNPLEQVQKFFATFHPGHFRLYNLCSERAYDVQLFDGRVECFPFDDHNPPKLAMVEAFCESVRRFLGEDERNVAAVHCKAGKGRTGTMLCCYLLHTHAEPNADAALNFFGVMRTSNGKGVTIPSQRRYVHYYDHHLKHGTPPAKMVRVNAVRFFSIPSFDLVTGGCDPYFKVYIDTTKVFDQRSHEASIKPARRRTKTHVIDVRAYNLVISGDCKFLFFDADVLGGNEKMFTFWLNTAFLTSSPTRLAKHELDGAVNDKGAHFDADFAIEVEWTALDRAKSMVSPEDNRESSESESEYYEEDDGEELEELNDDEVRAAQREGKALAPLLEDEEDEE